MLRTGKKTEINHLVKLALEVFPQAEITKTNNVVSVMVYNVQILGGLKLPGRIWSIFLNDEFWTTEENIKSKFSSPKIGS